MKSKISTKKRNASVLATVYKTLNHNLKFVSVLTQNSGGYKSGVHCTELNKFNHVVGIKRGYQVTEKTCSRFPNVFVVPMENTASEEKVETYRAFIERKLKKDLLEVNEFLDKKVEDHKRWTQLKHIIGQLRKCKPNCDEVLTKVHFGLDIYMTAVLEEDDRILVNVGCDCVMEMSYDEAEKYADIRLKLLRKEIDHWRKQACAIKAHIKVVLLAIHEIKK